MKDIIDDDSRDALVSYRMERAWRTLNEVNILLKNNLYSTAVNRLYYSVYYAAVALLLRDGHITTTHAGVRSMLGLHYIKTGLIDHAIGRGFMILFERRHRADYDDFIESTYEEVLELKPLAESFIKCVGDIVTATDLHTETTSQQNAKP